MVVRRSAETAIAALLVVLVVSMVAGQVLGQPILLSFVTTDSMEPTIDPGDGFVAVPAFAAGEPQPGDVVVFNAKELHDGGLTTHRIVERTENGYVTKGDANPFTDQDGPEPLVTDGQIVAEALQVNGEVVTIPYFGTAVMTLRSVVVVPLSVFGSGNAGPVLLGIGMVLLVLAGLSDGDRRDANRTRTRENVVAIRTLVVVAVVVVAGAATIAMALPAGVHEFGVVSSEDPTDDPQVVEPGGTTTVDYELHNGGVLPMFAISEPASGGVAVEPRRTTLGRGERVTATVTLSAPETPGGYLRHVHESRYLLVLPPALLVALHAVHPLLAVLAVDVVVGLFVVAVSVAVFGTGHVRMRSTQKVPFRTRLRRRFG